MNRKQREQAAQAIKELAEASETEIADIFEVLSGNIVSEEDISAIDSLIEELV